MTNLGNEGLGSRLRRLLHLLDGDLDVIYAEEAPGYRPRYTPFMKILADGAPHTIRDLAQACRVSHSAASQTISRMMAEGFVAHTAGADAREREIRLTAAGDALLPRLRERWETTDRAARDLEAEIGLPLAEVLTRAIAALESRPFRDRIRHSGRPGPGRASF